MIFTHVYLVTLIVLLMAKMNKQKIYDYVFEQEELEMGDTDYTDKKESRHREYDRKWRKLWNTMS